jgi:protein MBA1
VADLDRGDKDTIGQICADGLRTKLRAKLRARGREKVIWEFHGYLEKPKVVSSRAAEVSNGLGVRQAVVRVRSRQALIRYRPNGTRYFQTGAEQDVEEYVVIQKQKVHGREGPWMLWGTTDPTTLESWSSS